MHALTLLATLELDWNPWGPPWFIAVVIGAIAVFIYWLYRIDARRLSPWQRRFLLVWRLLALVVVLAVLAEPSYKLTTREERPPVVAIVVDESLSMDLPASRGNPWVDFYAKDLDRKKKNRYAAAKKQTTELIKEMVKTHRVKVYVGSDGLKAIADFPMGEEIPQKKLEETFAKNPDPSGSYSNLGEVLADVQLDQKNSKLSSIFLLSDGRLTGGTKLSVAGDEAARNKVQLNTIGFGTVEPLPDLQFVDLVAPPEANINDVMTIQVSIINTVRDNLKVDLKMFRNDGKEPIVTKPLQLRLGEKRVSVSTIPNEEGEVKYTLTLPKLPDELTHDNNEVSFHVNVVKRKLRVLFIAGSPTMEFHHLVPSLIRDKVMNVSCFLQSADVNATQQGNDILEELPRTPAEWNRYDVVILYDINPNMFTNEQENGLEQLIQSGGGIMFIAGRVHGLAALLQVRGAKMRSMLPVEINKNRHVAGSFDEYYTEPFHLVRTREGKRHPLLIFNPGIKKNDEVWQSFADLNFYWSHPVQAVKRQAIPLLVKKRKGGAGKQECVMALMRYGKGSSVYVGVHTMWRWRFPMESYDYDQFFSQTARYLAEYRMLGSQRQVLLNTDKKIYSPGETVRIQLSILDPALANQLRTEQIFATVNDPEKGEYKVMLQPSPKDMAALYGKFPARRLGEHKIRVNHVLAADIAAKKALFDEKKHFNVRMQSLEYKDTTADLPAMKELAERTGGSYLDHETMKEGWKKVPPTVNADPLLIPKESYDDLWDRWYVIAALLFFGTVELWFRRIWGLL